MVQHLLLRHLIWLQQLIVWIWFIHNIYQYYTTYINISQHLLILFIDSSTFENNHNIYLSQQLEEVINILDYKSIWLVEVLSYEFYAIFNLFL